MGWPLISSPLVARPVARAPALLAVGLLLLPALLLVAPPSSAATHYWDLYTNTTGWGWASINITSPGPTLTVDEGDTVNINLSGTDSNWHNFFVDYNGNGLANAGSGEPVAPDFRSPNTIAFSFVADLAGTFTYYCGYHKARAYGTFVVNAIGGPVNARPNATLRAPAPGSSLTGGSTTTVEWNMTDAEDPVSNLTAYLNYTSSAGAGTVAGPVLGSANPHSVNWTLPLINTTTLRVNLTVIDSGGRRAFAERLVGEVDSAGPRVTFVSPLNGTRGVDPAPLLQVGFSEGMNRSSAEAALTLSAVPDGAPVPLTLLGWAGSALTFSPTQPLANDTLYQVAVSASALDDSDPGNPLAPFTWTFRTRNNPPSGAVVSPGPSTRLTGGTPHNIAFAVEDSEDASAKLTVELFYARSAVAPFTSLAAALAGDSSPFAWTAPIDNTTDARIRLNVTDASGLASSALSAVFSIDSAAPAALSSAPANGTAAAVLNTRIVVSFSEPMDANSTASPGAVALFNENASAWVPGSFRWSSERDVLFFTPALLLDANSTYRIFVNITARDASDPGNRLARAFSSSFVTADFEDTQPPTIISSTITAPPSGSDLPIDLVVRTFDDTLTAEVWADVTGALGEPIANVSLYSTDGSRWTGSVAAVFFGDQFVRFWVCDIAGNCAEASGRVTLNDTTPPYISRLRAEPSSPIVPSTVRVSALASDGSGIRDVWIVLGPQNRTATYDAATRRYFADLAVTRVGTFTYTVWARDGAGLVHHESADFTAIDPVPPQLSAFSVNPAVPELGKYTLIRVRVTDNDAVSRVWLEVDDALNFSLKVPSPLEPYSVAVPAGAVGVHTYILWAEDNSSNRASLAGSFEVVDTTPPVIQHSPISTWTRSTPIEINAKASDLAGAVGVWVAFTGTNGRADNVSAHTSDGENFTARIPAQNLSGTFSYAVAAVDPSGNWAVSRVFDVEVPADPETVKPEDAGLLIGVLSTGAAIAAVDGGLVFALSASRRRARAAIASGVSPTEISRADRLVDPAIVGLLVGAAAGGAAILLTDSHLWDTASDHALVLLAFMEIDLALACLVFRCQPHVRLALIRFATLWAGVQFALMIGDIATAPQYDLTYSQFASYLFGQPAFVLVLVALSCAGILGLHAAGGFRAVLLARWSSTKD